MNEMQPFPFKINNGIQMTLGLSIFYHLPYNLLAGSNLCFQAQDSVAILDGWNVWIA